MFLGPADTDVPPKWIGTIQGASQAQALENAAQHYEQSDDDLTVKRQPTSAAEADAQAIQCAVDRAPQDKIATSVIVMGQAFIYRKSNLIGEDLQVQGLRWYVKVDLQHMEDESTAPRCIGYRARKANGRRCG